MAKGNGTTRAGSPTSPKGLVGIRSVGAKMARPVLAQSEAVKRGVFVSEADASHAIGDVLKDIDSNYRVTEKALINVGNIGPDIVNAFASIGISQPDGPMYISDEQIYHATRSKKTALGIRVNDNDLINFPTNRANMSVFTDSKREAIIYVDGTNKFVIRRAYNIPKKYPAKQGAYFITASKLRPGDNSFTTVNKNYIKLK